MSINEKNETIWGEVGNIFLIGFQSSQSLSSGQSWPVGASLLTSAIQQSEQQTSLCIPKKDCPQFYHGLTEKYI